MTEQTLSLATALALPAGPETSARSAEVQKRIEAEFAAIGQLLVTGSGPAKGDAQRAGEMRRLVAGWMARRSVRTVAA